MPFTTKEQTSKHDLSYLSLGVWISIMAQQQHGHVTVVIVSGDMKWSQTMLQRNKTFNAVKKDATLPVRLSPPCHDLSLIEEDENLKLV